METVHMLWRELDSFKKTGATGFTSMYGVDWVFIELLEKKIRICGFIFKKAVINSLLIAELHFTSIGPLSVK
jgi:hypothetical protein